MGRRKKGFVVEDIAIEKMAAEGKSLAHWDEKVLFVPYAAPGDVVDVMITRNKSKFAEGRVTSLKQASTLRRDPFCKHFSVCGGCKWQHIDYQEQLNYKQDQVQEQLTRIGKIELPVISPIQGPDKTTHYRNKLEYTFTNWRWLTIDEIQSEEEFDRRGLGFHVPGGFDKVIHLEECHLQDPISNTIRDAVAEFAKVHEIDFYNIKGHEGQLRNLIVRTASTGDLMIILQFAGELNEKIQALLEMIKNDFPQVTSLMYVINNKMNETFNDLDVVCYSGKDHIVQEMEGLEFKVGPKSFYQTNDQQAYELYKITRDFADLKGDELVYDLYTGTGTIANFIAKNAKKVVGIEYVEMAVEDARLNSKHNKIDNTSFFAGDMKDLLKDDFINKEGKPDVVITDPPRAGMHEDVTRQLLKVQPSKIVYVSCNPATQARDLEILDEKYKVARVQPVDMFPHTHHVENVVLLELRQNEVELTILKYES